MTHLLFHLPLEQLQRLRLPRPARRQALLRPPLRQRARDILRYSRPQTKSAYSLTCTFYHKLFVYHLPFNLSICIIYFGSVVDLKEVVASSSGSVDSVYIAYRGIEYIHRAVIMLECPFVILYDSVQVFYAHTLMSRQCRLGGHISEGFLPQAIRA